MQHARHSDLCMRNSYTSAKTLCCSADFHRKDVIPEGATIQYASPEQLQSLQLQFTLEHSFEPALINGQAADIWAVGVLCYVMMTGEHPFHLQDTSGQAPGQLPLAEAKEWEEYASMAAAHAEWVSMLYFLYHRNE